MLGISRTFWRSDWCPVTWVQRQKKGFRVRSTRSWLVVGPPLWKIWVRQLGWWNSQYFWENKIDGNQTTNPDRLYLKSPNLFWEIDGIDGMYPQDRGVSFLVCTKSKYAKILVSKMQKSYPNSCVPMLAFPIAPGGPGFFEGIGSGFTTSFPRIPWWIPELFVGGDKIAYIYICLYVTCIVIFDHDYG